MTDRKKGKKKFVLWIFLISVPAIFISIYYINREVKIPQGEITYQITYPYTELGGAATLMLPKEVIVTFKGSKLLTCIKKGNLFETTVLVDEKTKQM